MERKTEEVLHYPLVTASLNHTYFPPRMEVYWKGKSFLDLVIVFVIYRCITNHPKSLWHKEQQGFYSFHNSVILWIG